MKLFFNLLLLIVLCTSTYFCQDISQYPPNCFKNIPVLNFKDGDLRDIVRGIALQYKTNIVIDNQINKKISLALFDTKVIDALKIIASDNSLDFTFDKLRFYLRPKKEVIMPKEVEVKETPFELSYAGSKFSFNGDNVDIKKFTDKLINTTLKNFFLSNGTSGYISGLVKNLDLETGVRYLLQNNGFDLNKKDSVYFISRSEYFNGNANQKNGTDNSPVRYKGYWINAKNQKITIDVSQANLDRVINDIFTQLNIPIIKLAIPNNNVTIKCQDAPLDKVLSYLFLGSEFSYKKDDGVYIIGNKSAKSLEDTKMIKLQYLRADKVKENIPTALLSTALITTVLEQNAIVINGQNESITNLEHYIKTIDKPVPQVLIEAVVVDYNLDNTLQLGLSAGKGDSASLYRANKLYPGIDATVSGAKINKILNDMGTMNIFGKEFDFSKLGKLPSDFYVNLKALEEVGIANIKSKPILSSLNGHTASLKIGTVQNYVFTDLTPISNQYSTSFMEKERIEKIEANISFEITPWVGPNSELTLEIKPDFQTPVGEFNPDKKKIPAINTRTLVSTVRVKDGETIVLGGLIQDIESNTDDKLPLLGDIPFIGYLFSNISKKKSKSELIIYLTPKIFYGDEFGNQYFDYAK